MWRSTSDEGSPIGDAKLAVNDTAKKARKSVNKALDKTLEAASIPLPDSPVNLYVYFLASCQCGVPSNVLADLTSQVTAPSPTPSSRFTTPLSRLRTCRKTSKLGPRASRTPLCDSPANDRSTSRSPSGSCKAYVLVVPSDPYGAAIVRLRASS